VSMPVNSGRSRFAFGISDVGEPGTAVELSEDLADLALGIDCERVNAFDFKRSASDSSANPTPCNLVAAVEDVESRQGWDRWLCTLSFNEGSPVRKGR